MRKIDLTREQVLEIQRRAELCAEATLPGQQLRDLATLALKAFALRAVPVEAESISLPRDGGSQSDKAVPSCDVTFRGKVITSLTRIELLEALRVAMWLMDELKENGRRIHGY